MILADISISSVEDGSSRRPLWRMPWETRAKARFPRGTDYPSEEQLAALCKVFDVDKEFLVSSNHEGEPLSAMENDLLQRFRFLAQYNQRRLFRFADNLLILQREEQTVQHEERTVDREVEKMLYPEGHEKIYCSFCGKPQSLCERLIAGNGAYICEECIGLCTEILSEPFDKDEPTQND